VRETRSPRTAARAIPDAEIAVRNPARRSRVRSTSSSGRAIWIAIPGAYFAVRIRTCVGQPVDPAACRHELGVTPRAAEQRIGEPKLAELAAFRDLHLPHTGVERVVDRAAQLRPDEAVGDERGDRDRRRNGDGRREREACAERHGSRRT
jgi:hypothetical protein